MDIYSNRATSRTPDDNSIVIFRRPTEEEMQGFIDEKATREAGHTVYKDIELCEIRFPADRQRIFVAPAHALKPEAQGQEITYAMWYKPEYEAYLAKRNPTITGTPLESLPFLPQSKRFELKAMNIHSVEVLAKLDGPQLANLGMGGRALQQQAAAWLENAKGNADVTKMAAEIADLRRMLEEERGSRAGVSPVSQAAAPSDNKFLSMSDEDIKAYIKEVAGAAPRGNPSRDTLIRMANELADHAQESAA